MTCKRTGCQSKGANKLRQITAAPHYLRVQLDHYAGSENMDTTKNRNAIQIPPILDMTQHVKTASADESAWPLRYKLISVIYHCGESTNYGHWAAGVSRPLTRAEQQQRAAQAKRAQNATLAGAAKGSGQPGQSTVSKKRKRQDPVPTTGYYFCNDSQVEDLPAAGDENPLCRNPMTGPTYVDNANVAVLMYERLPHRTPRYMSELKTALVEDGYYAVGSGAPKEKKTDEKKKTDEEKKTEERSKGENEKKGENETEDAEKKETEKAETEKKAEEKKAEEEKAEEKKAEEKKAEEKKAEEETPEGRYPKRRRKAVSYSKMC